MSHLNLEHSIDAFKNELVRGARFSRPHEFPILEPSYYKPVKAIPFEKVYRSGDLQQWVHFYTLDRHFERIWSNPVRYLPILQRFSGVISPDFSLYREMPLAMQIWNTYRGRTLAYWLRKNGVKVVQNVRWSDMRSYSFAFEGLLPGGTFAVSTHGCIRDKLDRRYFKNGLARMLRMLKPQTIISYSQTPIDLFGKYLDSGIEIIEISHYCLKFRKEVE